MEREKISRKRRGIAVLTLAALFFWYLPQIQVSRQIRKEQEEAVEMYVREEKEENKEENEKSEEVQEQEPGSTDQNLSTAFFCMVNVPVIPASRFKCDIC